MATRRTRTMLARLWRIVELLQAHRRGLTVRRLVEETGTSRATVYRSLKTLEEAGVPLFPDPVNGEVRYCLDRTALPALRPSTVQLSALLLAREFLSPLEGTAMVAELDALIATRGGGRGADATGSVTRADRSRRHHPAIMQALDRAIRHRRRLRLRYRAQSSGETAWRRVDAVGLRMAGEQLYLIAWDLEREDWRTLKVARILAAHDLDEPCGDHPPFDEDELFGHAVRIWSSSEDPVEVAVQLSAEIAYLVAEWPLHPGQEVEEHEDGTVIVRARVAGVEETLRWTLSWGRDATVLEPPELVARHLDELAAALEQYRSDLTGPPLARAISSNVRQTTGSLDRAEGDPRVSTRSK